MPAANRPSILKTAILAGITGAILIDLYLWITEALLMHRATALILFQWDASNLLGPSAFRAGVGVALFGCLLHLIVSLIWGAIFTLAALQFRFLARNVPVWGVVFGVIVRLVMAHVIVPLGHAQMPPAHGMYLVNLYVAHIVFFGIPVTWVVSRGISQFKPVTAA
jgi:hypothetical protein